MVASRRAVSDAGESRLASGPAPWVLTFSKLLSETAFARDMRDMLRLLRDAYEHHVDIEYTASVLADNDSWSAPRSVSSTACSGRVPGRG